MKKLLGAISLLVLSAVMMPAQALPLAAGTYTFLDHPSGLLTNTHGPYGLRYDALNPPAGNGPTFSVQENGASVKLIWDGVSSAKVVGTLWNNFTNELWTVEYVMTGIADTVSATIEGFTSTGGTGYMTNGVITETFEGKQDNDGFAFVFQRDGHRLNNNNTQLVGRGWLLGEGINDWLVTVPEPASVVLLGLSLLGLGFAARRAK